jgi:hypothetical protein
MKYTSIKLGLNVNADIVKLDGISYTCSDTLHFNKNSSIHPL